MTDAAPSGAATQVQMALARRADDLRITPAPFTEVLARAAGRHTAHGTAPVEPALVAAVTAGLAQRAATVQITPPPFAEVVAAARGVAPVAPVPPAPPPSPPPSVMSPLPPPPVAPPPVGPPPSRGRSPWLALVIAATVLLVLGTVAYALTRDDGGAAPASTAGDRPVPGATSDPSRSTATSSTATSTTTTSTTTTTTTTTTSTVPVPAGRVLTVDLGGGGEVVVDGVSGAYGREPVTVGLSGTERVSFTESEDVEPGVLVEVVAAESGERAELPIGLDGVDLVLGGVRGEQLELVVSFEPREPEPATRVPGCFRLGTIRAELCLERRSG